MVKLAIAGASGQLAREVLDGLVESGNHEITALVRKDPKQFPVLPGVDWVRTDYEDRTELLSHLKGVHTVLCFFVTHMDPGGVNQKRLIDVCVEAGVKRYAASEWAVGMKLDKVKDIVPWYAGRLDIRTYLEELHREKKVLEYTLFHPGMFTNYLGYPHKTSQHISIFPILYDFKNMRAVALEGSLDATFTYTTVKDIVGVVSRAVEYSGNWPTVGGISGNNITVRQVLELGEKIRGKPFDIEWVQMKDLEQGILKTSWLPPSDHQLLAALPQEQRDSFTRSIVIGTLRVGYEEGWKSSSEWNELLPDYEFTGVEEFLRQAWA